MYGLGFWQECKELTTISYFQESDYSSAFVDKDIVKVQFYVWVAQGNGVCDFNY